MDATFGSGGIELLLPSRRTAANKDEPIADPKEFLPSRGWYAAREIPFHRGYLLNWTSAISLSRSGLDYTGLMSLSHPFQTSTLLSLRASQDGEKENKVPAGATDGPDNQAPSSNLGRRTRRQNLIRYNDQVLVSGSCRPGRMDVHIEFTLASKFQA
ncbi:hypothetical protein JOM56_011266 [Amanita muscaria]